MSQIQWCWRLTWNKRWPLFSVRWKLRNIIYIKMLPWLMGDILTTFTSVSFLTTVWFHPLQNGVKRREVLITCGDVPTHLVLSGTHWLISPTGSSLVIIVTMRQKTRQFKWLHHKQLQVGDCSTIITDKERALLEVVRIGQIPKLLAKIVKIIICTRYT